jgi:hypothetical protein
MKCDLASVETAPGTWRHACRRCGITRESSRPRLVRACRGAVRPAGPSNAERAASLAGAAARWAAAGHPLRGEPEVRRIFQEHCRPCEHFEPRGDDAGTCRLCGCRLKEAGGILNKIRWATENCPAGKW